MIIANPIYDIVFKKLMENLDIARGVLERILATQVDQLEFASQEFTAISEDGSLKFYRLDYKARILTTDGWKNVLIELQKARLATDVDRFRTYLAEEYRRVCEVSQPESEPLRQGLPIITIYFFGYTIDERLPGAIKIDRRYVDLVTGEELAVRCEVMERLTHDSYAVQIPLLGATQRNEVEELLAVFRQDHPADEKRHTLIVEDDCQHSPLVELIFRTLTRLTEKPEIQQSMTQEDVMFETLEREVQAKTREIQAEIREERRLREVAEAEIERLQRLLQQHSEQNEAR